MVQEIDKSSSFNTALAATATERVINKPTGAPYWNRLLVTNRSGVAIQVQLDGRTDQGYIYELKNGDGFMIDHTDGILFSSVDQKNLDAANAETVSTILFRAAYVVA